MTMKNTTALQYLKEWSDTDVWYIAGWIPTKKEFIAQLNVIYPPNFCSDLHDERERYIDQQCNGSAQYRCEDSARRAAAALLLRGANVVYVISPENYEWSMTQMAENAEIAPYNAMQLIARKIKHTL